MARKKIAAALRYYRGLCGPVLLEKGSGAMADRIIELARTHNVPVVAHDIVEYLMYVRRRSVIDEALFEVIADIYAFCVDLDRCAAGESGIQSGKTRR